MIVKQYADYCEGNMLIQCGSSRYANGGERITVFILMSMGELC
jgi:hypothetical protein